MRYFLFFFFIHSFLWAQNHVWFNSLEEAMKNPNEVVKLKLKRKKLTCFPKDLFLFPNLKELDLSKNRIQAFPKDLSILSTLQFLNLSRNKIETIPKHIAQMTALVHLDLWDNMIDFIPEEISQLKELNYLDLRGVSMSKKEYAQYNKIYPDLDLFLNTPCDCAD